MAGDTELQASLARLAEKGQAELTRAERITRQRALDTLDVPAFGATCKVPGGPRACERRRRSLCRVRALAACCMRATALAPGH
jgi:hypothetical protein